MEKIKIALCQFIVTDNKIKNVDNAVKYINEASKNEVNVVMLPEMFNCPYSNKKFYEYSESKEESYTLNRLSETVKKNNIYLIGGTIPEKDDNKIYNTCFIFDKNGNIVSKYRKMHLFDIDIPKKIRFLESDVLTAGSDLTLIDTEICKIGIAICYDMRFPEIFRIMALAGAQIILAPASFNMITGPLHWELLIKSRALDNQVFFGACSTARSNKNEYISYGNSMICDPWANIVARGSFGEEIIYGEIDLSKNLKYRSELPLIKHRRKDLYSIKYKSTGIY